MIEGAKMIKRINIPNFGSFSGFDWNANLRVGQTIHEFKRLNILYGRNYSGKTTLSRIFRSYEVGKLPENYKNPEFEVTSDEGSLSQNDILTDAFDIRVYNKDFIDENLSFLKDQNQGEVKTFAILGSENKEIEQKISEKEARLGVVETKSGLRFEHAQKKIEYTNKDKRSSQAEQALEDKLRRHANDVIKPNRTFGHPGYNIAEIKKDIKSIENKSLVALGEDEIKRRQDLLREEALPDIDVNVSFTPSFSAIHDNAKTILSKEVTPSAPIQELLNDALLQSWVRSGMERHRGKRTTCGFCGQQLPEDIWKRLDAHFNKESSDLEEEVNRQIKVIEAEIEAASSISLPDKENFYASEYSSFEFIQNDIRNTLRVYQTEINKILKQLQARQKNIFKSIVCQEVVDVSKDLTRKIEDINQLIKKNNAITGELPKQQQAARNELRENAVVNFIRDIDLNIEKEKIAGLKKEALSAKEGLEAIENDIKNIESEIEKLQVKLQDEKKGADKVNEYLNHFFGHEGLRLEAVEDKLESKFKFNIMRGSDPAYNMSEGECSLVSFCYFMARLDDIESSGKELVIYIDDPISSLDSNHIFFVFSLIESVIAKPARNADSSKRFRYKQLFISTHNLDFFKYLIRLSRPDKQGGGREFFLVEKQGGVSTLRLMPKYLKDYQTEFHYLFHQIYRCKDGHEAHENHEVFYNFGNNMRKFLEAYLFYKYPYKDDKDSASDRLHKFFGEDSTATALTNRVNNELSHLEEIFDRSMRPIEIPEIPSVANFVLDKMYEKDKEQFNALLQSIGEPARED